MASHVDLIAQFVAMTSASTQDAEQYLSNSSWDLSSAVTEFYNPPDDADDVSEPPQPTPSNPQPIPTTSSIPPPPSASTSKPARKFATLGDLPGGSGSHAGHGHDDDDDDDEDDDPNLYAGGEKSGLAVENPDDLKKKILDRATRNAHRPGGDDPRGPTSRFTGIARTLGGDDTPSEVIPDPNAVAPQRLKLVKRRLHFWADGFSVDDGPLFRRDDPRNAEILAQIKQGRAPIHILNVTPDQEVDVELDQHKENYVQPKKKYKPFDGGGQRLGSPTPDGDAPSAPTTQQAAPVAKPAATTGSTQPTMDINESEPTISLQIRLGDGTRLVSRFNTTHTIGDVYEFADASSPAGRSRAWVLMTTFPSKELEDKSQVLGDLAEFKRGGVVVQKWK